MRGLSPEAWADAALDVISEEGLEALNVESLARRLGVTKGSFYWHFSSGSALLRVALARWERRETEVLRLELAAISEPRARLRRLLWRGGDRVLDRLGTSSDPSVQEALRRVRERRTGQLSDCYVELGVEPAAARRRALLAYAAYAGLSHLVPEDALEASELLVPSA